MQVRNMVFVCEHCHFLFSRSQQPEQCPDCGKYAVRPAEPDEQAEFERCLAMQKDMEDFKVTKDQHNMDLFPDFCEVVINNHMSYFTFLLPVTSFGYRDDMLLELSAEYWKSEDEKQYQANVWAREKGAKTKHFVYPASVPVSEDPETSIVEALNQNDDFISIMSDVICEIAKDR